MNHDPDNEPLSPEAAEALAKLAKAFNDQIPTIGGGLRLSSIAIGTSRGWSLDLLLREVSDLAFGAGGGSGPFPGSPPVPFPQIVEHVRRMLSSDPYVTRNVAGNRWVIPPNPGAKLIVPVSSFEKLTLYLVFA